MEGMKCVHCQGAVQKAVSQLDGVVKAEVSLSPGSLEVEFDENVVTIDVFCQRIEQNCIIVEKCAIYLRKMLHE